jgi:membrane-associated phospholipid phosphatase
MVNNIEEMVIIEKAGDIIQVLLPIFAYIKYKGFIKSFLLTNILCHSLKLTTKRVRPNGRSTTSFPSGHTAATFFLRVFTGFVNNFIFF